MYSRVVIILIACVELVHVKVSGAPNVAPRPLFSNSGSRFSALSSPGILHTPRPLGSYRHSPPVARAVPAVLEQTGRRRRFVNDDNLVAQITALENIIDELTEEGQGATARAAGAKLQAAAVAAAAARAEAAAANRTTAWAESAVTAAMTVARGEGEGRMQALAEERANMVRRATTAAAREAVIARAEAESAAEIVQQAAASILKAAERADRAKGRLKAAEKAQAAGTLSRWDAKSIKDAQFHEAALPRAARKAEAQMSFAAERLVAAAGRATAAAAIAEDAVAGKNITFDDDFEGVADIEAATPQRLRFPWRLWPWIQPQKKLGASPFASALLNSSAVNTIRATIRKAGGERSILAQDYFAPIGTPIAAAFGLFAGSSVVFSVLFYRQRPFPVGMHDRRLLSHA
eukprot:gnl/TRDRNA2_/TRDRNA2_176733_c0_seq2.p1 gnl/TRDRNA2_/TRDRNA2_176733_c0~~gnl/TRDRNA2_/TRDRNA2_176733_c0_seq2.p1  ORF type:complete len:405 (-),score=69.76 gnl/TRDRNA2_/TRDRNA2_176733_c0_seq2:66-1280(-)